MWGLGEGMKVLAGSGDLIRHRAGVVAHARELSSDQRLEGDVRIGVLMPFHSVNLQ